MSSEKKYIHFNCPIELLKEFDRTIQGRYNSRTDAILDAMRKLIKELKQKKEELQTRLEEIVSTSIEKTLHSMGMPTKKDIERLEKKIEALRKQEKTSTKKK